MTKYSYSGNDYADKADHVSRIEAVDINDLQDEVEIVEGVLTGGTDGQVLTANAEGKANWEDASGGGGFPTGVAYYGASPVQDLSLGASDSGKVYYFDSPADTGNYHQATLPNAEDGLIFSFITNVRGTYKSLKINAQSGEIIRGNNAREDHTYDRVTDGGTEIKRMAITLVGIADDSFTGWIAISETNCSYNDGSNMYWRHWSFDPPPP